MFTTYVWRRHLRLALFVFVFISFQSCNTEDPFPLDPIRGVTPADNGNAGNGSDLEVFISEQLENANIVEYRAMVVKASHGGLTLGEANGTANYEAAAPDDVFPIQGIVFNTDSRDTDGDLIQNNVDYQVGVLSVARDQKERSNSFLLSTEIFQLTQNNQVSDHTREFQAGAGSLTLDAGGLVVMGEYNIVGELSEDASESYTVFQMDEFGSVRELKGPYRLLGGNTRDNDGYIYQSILNYARVVRIAPNGDQNTIVLSNFDVSGNDGVYVNANQEMFVVNPESGTILKWNLESGENEVVTRIGMRPRGITGDDQGNLYISHNHEDGVITKLSADGVLTELARVPTFKPEFYNIPYFMWVGYITYHDGDLYVAGMSTDRIYKISMQGEVEVFVGSGTRGIPRGGALTANLNRPIGLVFSEDGNTLYISGSTDNVPQHTQASTPVKIWQVSIVE